MTDTPRIKKPEAAFHADRRADPEFAERLAGYSLTTAEILYRMPDARSLLQSFVWQQNDIAPKFPRLQAFLDFWDRELEGPIHSVRVTHAQLLRPVDVRAVQDFPLH
ncbi:MAG: aspartate-semialdehyde dehydrogenase [Pseudomonadota bacterium]